MKRALWTLALLAGCGNAPEVGDLQKSLQAGSALPSLLLNRRPATDPAAEAQLRAALEADGQPSIEVSAEDRHIRIYMVPYYQPHDGVQTWISLGLQSVSLRDGVLVGSRGLGDDILAASAPSAAALAAGPGSFRRVYERLDGADQVVEIAYDCAHESVGSEAVVVLGRAYATRKVVETCSGPDGSFTNSYWLDGGGHIRQSAQFIAKGRQPLRIQRIID